MTKSTDEDPKPTRRPGRTRRRRERRKQLRRAKAAAGHIEQLDLHGYRLIRDGAAVAVRDVDEPTLAVLQRLQRIIEDERVWLPHPIPDSVLDDPGPNVNLVIRGALPWLDAAAAARDPTADDDPRSEQQRRWEEDEDQGGRLQLEWRCLWLLFYGSLRYPRILRCHANVSVRRGLAYREGAWTEGFRRIGPIMVIQEDASAAAWEMWVGYKGREGSDVRPRVMPSKKREKGEENEEEEKKKNEGGDEKEEEEEAEEERPNPDRPSVVRGRAWRCDSARTLRGLMDYEFAYPGGLYRLARCRIVMRSQDGEAEEVVGEEDGRIFVGADHSLDYELEYVEKTGPEHEAHFHVGYSDSE